jgi:hypothetical protein
MLGVCNSRLELLHVDLQLITHLNVLHMGQWEGDSEAQMLIPEEVRGVGLGEFMRESTYLTLEGREEVAHGVEELSGEVSDMSTMISISPFAMKVRE